MSADLNYSIKRLVRGLTSDNHAVKQGHFLATATVLSRFRKSIDVMKLLKLITEETKTSKSMKQPEVHANTIGRLMCLSAIVDAQLYQQSATQLNHEVWNKLCNDLLVLWKENDYLHESVQQVLVKMLSRVVPTANGMKLLERIASELIGSDYRAWAFQHADKMSMFLAIRKIYNQRYQQGGKLKGAEVYEYQPFKDTLSVKKIGKLLGVTSYLLPR